MNDILQPPATSGALVEPALAWRNHFASLGSAFFTELQPTPLPSPSLVGLNQSLVDELGLDGQWLASPAGVDVLTGNRLLAGSRPLASVYSGHQFGVWAGQLGDGRAILLGGIDTRAGPQELQLKGAGRTPYSRMGDGRAVLRSSIREYLGSEAMQGLGIPSTRALAVTGSAAPVRREEVETAAVVTRVAPSFVRFGHFEHFSHHGQHAALKVLADFVIDQHYPDCRAAANPYAALLSNCARRRNAIVKSTRSAAISVSKPSASPLSAGCRLARPSLARIACSIASGYAVLYGSNAARARSLSTIKGISACASACRFQKPTFG